MRELTCIRKKARGRGIIRVGLVDSNIFGFRFTMKLYKTGQKK
jgi:hypothetical protein